MTVDVNPLIGTYTEDGGGNGSTLQSHSPSGGVWYVDAALLHKAGAQGGGSSGIYVAVLEDSSGDPLYRNTVASASSDGYASLDIGIYYYAGHTLEVQEYDQNDQGTHTYQVDSRRIL